jgi:hypothetical protein
VSATVVDHVTQRDAALRKANATRLSIAAVRRRAQRGEITLSDLMLYPRPEFEQVPLVDVVRLVMTRRHGPALEGLGRAALRDGVNLMLPMGHASLRTRMWVAENVLWQRHRRDARNLDVGVRP